MIANAAGDVAEKVKKIIDKHNPVTGMIVSVSNDKVYIDIGSDNGVHINDTLIVYKEGKVIRHPVSGEIITVEEVVLGKLKVENTSEEYSVCKIIKENDKITEGCYVKRG